MSLCFKTNVKCYGPYGDATGTSFSLDCKAGAVIVGFHGLVFKPSPMFCVDPPELCVQITAIGVYVLPELFAFSPNSLYSGRSVHESSLSLSRVEMPREVGPWGASGGKPWDDGVFSSVKQVSVYLGELHMIYALQFEYLKKDGKSVVSQIHGRIYGAKKIELVSLDGVEEFFTGISGFFGPVEGQNGLEAIASISFHTNKGIHGPYGEEKGAGYYRSTTSSGKIVGFQGRNNGFLSAIGVHMEYFEDDDVV
ncbi:hypothetical protein QVD17_16026 [Tagetes erecta]|uniref:Jacalin-type lectin domain-containing protein n=1 Tax=Tagetes erecta TaxID=13708 RepID=A0AAD8KTH2_TARER|nr:hypothetical protein QVD17_16026 [Tagetes erecta]